MRKQPRMQKSKTRKYYEREERRNRSDMRGRKKTAGGSKIAEEYGNREGHTNEKLGIKIGVSNLSP